MTEEIEQIRIVDHGDHIIEERVVHDPILEGRIFAARFSSLIWMVFGFVIGLIALRVFLKLIAANPQSPFAGMVYAATDLFLWPFAGLTVTPSVGPMVLEIPAIIAMFVFALLGWVAVRLIRFVFFRL